MKPIEQAYILYLQALVDAPSPKHRILMHACALEVELLIIDEECILFYRDRTDSEF